MADGFLGRWARRKEAARQGKVLEDEAPAEVLARVPPPQPSPKGGGSEVRPSPGGGGSEVKGSSSRGGSEEFPPPLGEGQGGGSADQPSPPPPPTLDDVQSLTPDSDFARFVKPDVAPEVKNAALKKLFADPHFNVMDRLDIYIDDYGKPDPIPPEMLRSLASSRFLGLFRDEEEEKSRAGREGPDDGAAQTVAQSGEPAEGTPSAVPTAEPDAHPDLRLQQDDAPGPEGPGPRPE